MSVLTVEQRGDMAEALLPVAAHLVTLVHGDGGPEDVRDVLAALTAQQKDALLVVLAGLVDPEQPVGKALGWLEFTEERDLVVPPWAEHTRIRELAPEPDVDGDIVDVVAVDQYVAGRGTAVTDEERLIAIRRLAGRGRSFQDVDGLQNLPLRSTENFVNMMKKRYTRHGRGWVPMPRMTTSEFTPNQVRELRERYALGGVTDQELALRCGVARKVMTSLLSGVSYQSAGGPIRAKRTVASAASKQQFNGPVAGVAVAFNQTRI